MIISSSYFQRPQHMLHDVIEPQWFPERKEETESSYVMRGPSWRSDQEDANSLTSFPHSLAHHQFSFLFLLDWLHWKLPKKLICNIFKRSWWSNLRRMVPLSLGRHPEHLDQMRVVRVVVVVVVVLAVVLLPILVAIVLVEVPIAQHHRVSVLVVVEVLPPRHQPQPQRPRTMLQQLQPRQQPREWFCRRVSFPSFLPPNDFGIVVDLHVVPAVGPTGPQYNHRHRHFEISNGNPTAGIVRSKRVPSFDHCTVQSWDA